MAKGKGLLMLLGGPPPSKGKADDSDDMDDDYPEDSEDSGNDDRAAFNAHAEEALGTSDPARLDAFWQAVKACMEMD